MENLYAKRLMSTKTNIGIIFVLKSVLREFSILAKFLTVATLPHPELSYFPTFLRNSEIWLKLLENKGVLSNFGRE